jgi:hypothetical protein
METAYEIKQRRSVVDNWYAGFWFQGLIEDGFLVAQDGEA